MAYNVFNIASRNNITLSLFTVNKLYGNGYDKIKFDTPLPLEPVAKQFFLDNFNYLLLKYFFRIK